ncbi:hypothetical protein AC578_5901 [Pseudocercospora eumusae]|uniref:Uncharacterized protein n=1 Tax=Pseudocercospora eumusae TaxID=321146 RepID=A0A139HBF1_9PEZI|nr:hypothetical protein AC578_5901 [Pseudocercospora eumusae]
MPMSLRPRKPRQPLPPTTTTAKFSNHSRSQKKQQDIQGPTDHPRNKASKAQETKETFANFCTPPNIMSQQRMYTAPSLKIPATSDAPSNTFSVAARNQMATFAFTVAMVIFVTLTAIYWSRWSAAHEVVRVLDEVKRVNFEPGYDDGAWPRWQEDEDNMGWAYHEELSHVVT